MRRRTPVPLKLPCPACRALTPLELDAAQKLANGIPLCAEHAREMQGIHDVFDTRWEGMDWDVEGKA